MKKSIWKLIALAGIALILAAGVLLAWSGIRSRQTTSITRQLEDSLPPRFTGYEGIYSDAAMPSLAIDGKDFVGILDVPGFGVKLPIGGSWDTGKLSAYPCRFWGSAYDGTLIIGGSGQSGQLSFCAKVDIKDVLTLTDMTGAEFDYEVVWVDRAKSAETKWLMSDKYDLTIFARDPFSMEYIAVRCNLRMQSPEAAAVPTGPIAPLPQTLDITNLEDCSAAVSLTPGGIYQENGSWKMELTVCVYDYYDLVDIARMQEGDELILHDRQITVETLERTENGSVLINGGLDFGGCELITEDHTVWYEIGYSDVKSWYPLGTVQLDVAPSFQFTDNSDPDGQPKNLTVEQLAQHPQLSGGFTPHNTTAMIVDGQISYLYRIYTP